VHLRVANYVNFVTFIRCKLFKSSPASKRHLSYYSYSLGALGSLISVTLFDFSAFAQVYFVSFKSHCLMLPNYVCERNGRSYNRFCR